MKFPFHILLIATLPVIQILSVNRDSVTLSQGLFPMGIAIGFGLVVWLLCTLILRGNRAGAIAASVFLVCFYMYSPLQSGFAGVGLRFLSRNTMLLPILILMVILAGHIAYRANRNGTIGSLTSKLNVFALILVLLAGLGIVRGSKASAEFRPFDLPAVQDKSTLPNIYWIVLDAYARADVLREEYGFDNSKFIGELDSLGVRVDPSARSNYSQTTLSLASLLNSAYLPKEISNRKSLTRKITNNRFAESLRTRNYTKVTFSTGYSLTEDAKSDRYFASRHFLGRNPINGMLINRTPLKLLVDRILRPANGHIWHRDRVLDNFGQLGNMSEIEPPFFAFAHIVSPHQPFIFDREGKYRPPESSFSMSKDLSQDPATDVLYLEQLQFVNRQVLKMVNSILVNDRNPVIIIQSDHGPKDERRDRMKILSATYPSDLIPEDIHSPVNYGRFVLNRIFDSGIPPLEEKSLWSSYESPFDFVEIE